MPDREKVIKGLKSCSEVDCTECQYGTEGHGHKDCVERLCADTLAMLKEQLEIIRCKDCKHYDGDENSRLGTCLENGVCSTPEWFCADGERKSADEILMEEMDADPLG